MAKSWQLFEALECPECGDSIEVYTDEQADEFEQFAYDGDDCKCMSGGCEFESCLSVDADFGELFIQDSLIN